MNFKLKKKHTLKTHLITIFSVLIISGCTSLLYHPQDHFFYNPNKFNLTYEEHVITDKNETLHSWLFPTPNAELKHEELIIYFHGNGENLTSHFISLSWLPASGFSYAIFDYPGYHLSSGIPTPESTVQSGITVIEYYAKKFPDKKIFIYGHSLGGAIALRTYIELPRELKKHIYGMILDQTFYSYQMAARNVLRKSWITWALQPLTYILIDDAWSAKDKLNQLGSLPKLIMHSKDDQVIHYDLGKDLFEHLPEPKKMITLESSPHGGTFFANKGTHRKDFIDFIIEHSK